jgi:hypothetical protein
MSSGGRFEILRSSDAQYYFVLKARNHEVTLTSETYKEKSSAYVGIASVRENAPLDSQYQRLLSQAGEPYFVLRAKNHEVIGCSEMYSSSGARETGIQAVKSDAPDAAVIDHS